MTYVIIKPNNSIRKKAILSNSLLSNKEKAKTEINLKNSIASLILQTN